MPAPAAAAASAAPARPGPRRRTAAASASPTPVGCHADAARLPIHSPTGSRCRAISRSVLTNCTWSGSAWRPKALPQSASGLIRWNGDISSSGQQRHGAHPHRRRPGAVVLARRVADLDGAAEPGPVVGDPTDGELDRARCRRGAASASPLLSMRASKIGVGRRRGACRSPSPRTLPSASSERGRGVRRRPAGAHDLGGDREPGHRHRPAEVDRDARQAHAGQRPARAPARAARSAARRGRRRGPTARGRDRSG